MSMCKCSDKHTYSTYHIIYTSHTHEKQQAIDIAQEWGTAKDKTCFTDSILAGCA